MGNGENLVVVQEISKTDSFAVGDAVRVMQSNGKTRVAPAPKP
jgi:outer membrane lipoprotein SlyB